MTIFHVGYSLNALINGGDAALMAGHIRFTGQETWATEAEIIAHCAILRAKGMELLPSCSKYDATGRCTGHESRDEDEA